MSTGYIDAPAAIQAAFSAAFAQHELLCEKIDAIQKTCDGTNEDAQRVDSEIAEVEAQVDQLLSRIDGMFIIANATNNLRAVPFTNQWWDYFRARFPSVMTFPMPTTRAA